MAASDHDRIAAAYRRFADEEVRGRSALYETIARAIADDTGLLALLDTLPLPKRQPNLLFAAVRHIAGVPPDWPAFRQVVRGRWHEVRAIMLSHSTQTNEPGRCATLLPVFARLPQPLALIEVGASAGLCLLPDRYAYSYGQHSVRADNAPADTPVFPCQASPETPLPVAMPRIVWRAGLDLNPLDVNNEEQMAWLETLVWPEDTDRAERLRKAVRIARADPPRVLRGDLRDGVAALAAEAPKDATLVVFHTAVLGYLPDRAERDAFATAVSTLCDYWIANEAPRVMPGIAARAPAQIHLGRFIVAVNGEPVAWAAPHGSALEWIGEPQAHQGSDRGRRDLPPVPT
jgi:hypothetical protein